MRVIAGKARSLQLKTVPGMNTRPTTDRIKETLFNMIAPGICDCVFLDLFSGSGAIGIEALSRGASRAVFIEKNPAAVTCIRQNLAHTKLSDQAEVIAGDVFTALKRLEGRYTFDYIFMDPPYDNLLEKEVLQTLSQSSLLSPDGVIIVEASLQTSFSYLQELGFVILKRKEYKTNAHIFIEREE